MPKRGKPLGPDFTLLTIGANALECLKAHGLNVPRPALEATPEFQMRYLGAALGAIYLIRPDQHVAARWDRFDAAAVSAALVRAIGKC